MTSQPDKFIRKFRTVIELASWAQLYENDDRVITINKFGQNRDIDAGQTEDIWDKGGQRAYPDTLEQFDIVSSSAADDSAGTGARTVSIQGLDADYNLLEEIITLDGLTPVRTVNSFYNIHRMVVLTAGSGNGNAGTISATGVTSTNIMACINIGMNITQMTHYMIPSGYIGFLLDEEFSVYRADGNGSRQGEITHIVHPFGGVPLRTETLGLVSSATEVPKLIPERYDEKTLMYYEGQAATVSTAFSTTYSLLMVRKELVK